MWSAALHFEPHNTGVRLNRAFAYIETGKIKEAVDDYSVAADEGDAAVGSVRKCSHFLVDCGDGLVEILRATGQSPGEGREQKQGRESGQNSGNNAASVWIPKITSPRHSKNSIYSQGHGFGCGPV